MCCPPCIFSYMWALLFSYPFKFPPAYQRFFHVYRDQQPLKHFRVYVHTDIFYGFLPQWCRSGNISIFYLVCTLSLSWRHSFPGVHGGPPTHPWFNHLYQLRAFLCRAYAYPLTPLYGAHDLTQDFFRTDVFAVTYAGTQLSARIHILPIYLDFSNLMSTTALYRYTIRVRSKRPPSDAPVS